MGHRDVSYWFQVVICFHSRGHDLSGRKLSVTLNRAAGIFKKAFILFPVFKKDSWDYNIVMELIIYHMSSPRILVAGLRAVSCRFTRGRPCTS